MHQRATMSLNDVLVSCRNVSREQVRAGLLSFNEVGTSPWAPSSGGGASLLEIKTLCVLQRRNWIERGDAIPPGLYQRAHGPPESGRWKRKYAPPPELSGLSHGFLWTFLLTNVHCSEQAILLSGGCVKYLFQCKIIMLHPSTMLLYTSEEGEGGAAIFDWESMPALKKPSLLNLDCTGI